MDGGWIWCWDAPFQIVDPETADAAVRKDKPRGNALCVRFYPKGDQSVAFHLYLFLVLVSSKD